nr:hypothetical protein CFP56_56897 [Quercus suber]
MAGKSRSMRLWEVRGRWKRGDELQAAAENSIRNESNGFGPSCRITASLAKFCIAIFKIPCRIPFCLTTPTRP